MVRLAKKGQMGDSHTMKHIHTWVGVYIGIALAGGLLLAESARAQNAHVLGWGLNANFQASPIPTNIMDDASAIAGGSFHSLALKDGRVTAWGDNTSGQTNVPVSAQSGVTQMVAGGQFSMALTTDGVVVPWGIENMSTGMPVSATSGVSQIAAGEWHALALKNGGIIAWGSNGMSQCDVPVSLTSGVSAISAGGYYSMALKDGGVQVFGIPSTNELALGIRDVPSTVTNGVSAISAGKWHALALKDGGVIAWGACYDGTNSYNDATNVPLEATSDVMAISAGDLFSMALKTDGTLVIWEETFNGQTNIPSFAATGITQIAAGGGHCLIIGPVMPPRFIEESLPEAYVGEAYSGFAHAVGDPSVTYYKSGLWPSWVTLDSMTGDIGGNPGIEHTNRNYFAVLASNSISQVTNSCEVWVWAERVLPPVFVTTNPLPDGIVNDYYSMQIVASNNPTFSLVVGEGDLPDGLTLSTNGLVSGYPTMVQDHAFMVRATNISGGVSNVYNIDIKAPTNPPVFVTTSPLPNGEVGQSYAVQIVVSNGAIFSLLAGSLPDGLILTSSGMVTGTPTQIDMANFTVQATNVMGSSNRVYDLEIVGPPLFITTSPLPDGTLDAPYSQQIEADGDPTFMVVAGSVPDGLTLNAAGVLAGTPTVQGPFNFTVHATNDYGWSNRVYDMEINEIPAFITTNPLPSGEVAVPYSKQIEATGSPLFSIFSGTLPGGLGLSTGGLLDGTPTQAGTFNFTIRATNDYGWSHRVYDLEITGFEEPSFTYGVPAISPSRRSPGSIWAYRFPRGPIYP